MKRKNCIVRTLERLVYTSGTYTFYSWAKARYRQLWKDELTALTVNGKYGTAIDLGCGRGAAFGVLSEFALKIIGIDVDLNVLKESKAITQSGTNLIAGDIDNLPLLS